MPTIELPASGVEVIPFVIPLIGFVVGLFSGLLGLGGGWLVTPALNVLGIPAPFAVGTSLTQMVATTSLGAWKHWRMGNLKGRLALILAPVLAVGVHVGKFVMIALEGAGFADDVVRLLHLTLATTMGVLILGESLKKPREKPVGADASSEKSSQKGKGWFHLPLVGPLLETDGRVLPWYAVIFFPFVAGVISSVMGIGGGVIMMPVMIYIFRLTTISAVATVLVCTVVASVNGSAIYAFYGKVEWLAAGLILLGSLVGSWIGAGLTSYSEGRGLRVLFGMLLVATAASIALTLGGFELAAKVVIFGSAGILTTVVLMVGWRARRRQVTA